MRCRLPPDRGCARWLRCDRRRKSSDRRRIPGRLGFRLRLAIGAGSSRFALPARLAAAAGFTPRMTRARRARPPPPLPPPPPPPPPPRPPPPPPPPLFFFFFLPPKKKSNPGLTFQ